MVGIPILGYLAHYFYVKSPCEIQQNFGWISYVFLCSIFVTMTNQVILVTNAYKQINLYFVLFLRYTSGRTHIGAFRSGCFGCRIVILYCQGNIIASIMWHRMRRTFVSQPAG